MISEGDIWLVSFPLEEDPTEFLPRPVIVLNVQLPYILSTKITKHDPRTTDSFDTPILHGKMRILITLQRLEYQRPYLLRYQNSST